LEEALVLSFDRLLMMVIHDAKNLVNVHKCVLDMLQTNRKECARKAQNKGVMDILKSLKAYES
jgi:uncharacterized protein YjgD (DUF1641 family)